jgi:hypothetical protein
MPTRGNLPNFELWLRLGYATRGLIYATVGLLAVQVALSGRGQLTDQKGAIAELGTQPFGKFLLLLIVIGLAGYAVWGFVRCLLDPLNKGNDAKGILQRLGYLFSGVSYGALAIPAARFIATGNGPANGASDTQRMAGTVLTYAWGPWAVALAGMVGVGAGLAEISKAWRADFDMQFDPYALSSAQRKGATRLGRIGTAARGLVFGMMGVFLLQAAVLEDAQKVKGLDGSLQALAHQPYGAWLLGVVALGLLTFGIYSILGALWFHLKPHRA